MDKCYPIHDIVICDLNDSNFYEPEHDKVIYRDGQEVPAAERSKKLKEILKHLKAPSWKSLLLQETSDYFENIHEAEENSWEGKPELTEESLKEAQEISKKLSIFFDHSRAKELIRYALQQGIQELIRQAEGWKQNHLDLEGLKSSLKKAETYQNRLNQEFKPNKPFDRVKAQKILRAAKEYFSIIPKPTAF